MKKAVFLVLLLTLFATAFAETPSKAPRVTQFLSASDIDAFLKNHKAIKDELAKAGFSEKDFGFDFTANPDFDTLNFLNSLKTPPQVDAVFAKYGMGKNGSRKLFIMDWATGVSLFERAFKPGSGSPAMMDAETYNALMEKYYECVNPEDLKLVRPHCDELYAIFAEDREQGSESAPVSGGSPSEELDEETASYDEETLDDEDSSQDEDAEWPDSDEGE